MEFMCTGCMGWEGAPATAPVLPHSRLAFEQVDKSTVAGIGRYMVEQV